MKWISVEDRLPNCSGTYLVNLNRKHDNRVEQVYFEFNDDMFYYDRHDGILGEVEKYGYSITHWMQLPEPPTN